MNRTQFLVSPKGSKCRYYTDLLYIAEDYNKRELEGANIEVLLNGVVVGSLNTVSVLNEVFGY